MCSHSRPGARRGAAQLPPRSNLAAVLATGVDLAVFSGGKGFQGPQASGLVLGNDRGSG
jgi:seryl-tRNA(Sec) selenium transferase